MDTEVLQMLAFVLVLAAISVLSMCVYRTVLLGRRCAHDGHMHIPQHKRVVNRTIFAMFFLIFSIETFSYFSTVHMTGTWIFAVHMLFAVPFLLLLLALRFFVTGIERKHLHKPLAYTAALCFVGVVLTGGYMLVTMFLA